MGLVSKPSSRALRSSSITSARRKASAQQASSPAANAAAVGRSPATGEKVGAQTVGSDLSTYLVKATGSPTYRSLGDRAADVVNVKDFGAKGDGVTDDTAAIQAAVLAAGQAYAAALALSGTNPTGAPAQLVVFTGGSTYKVATGPILVPTGVDVDGRWATFLGPGSTGTVFESGYFSAGVLVTNYGTPPESHIIDAMTIRHAIIKNAAIAIRVQNFNRGSAIDSVLFYNCKQAVKASRSFYGVFRNLRAIWPAVSGSTPGPMFHWTTTAGATDSVNNAMTLDGITCDGGGVLQLCYRFDGGVDGLVITSLTAENAVNGVTCVGEVVSLTWLAGYMENLTGTGFDFTDSAAHRGIVIDGTRFYQVAVGIDGVQMISGRIGAGCYFRPEGSGVPVKVRINDDTASFITVEVPPTGVNTNGTPVLPSGFTLGKGVRVVFPFYTFSNSTGIATTRQNYTGGLVELPWSGRSGSISGGIPYATGVANGGAGTLTITTAIMFDNYGSGPICVFIADNVGSYQWNGRFYGSSTGIAVPEVVWDRQPGGGKTCTVANVGGLFVFTFGGLTAPIAFEGTIRMF